MGDEEASSPEFAESLLGYHPFNSKVLTSYHEAGNRTLSVGQFDWGGRLQKSTEAFKGSLRMVGNHSKSTKAKASLTARHTGRAETKVGLSDPVVPSGRAIAQRIKATPGITGLSPPRVHIDGEVWHLDVGSSHPGAGVGSKGWAVRPLKRHASWVQNVVRQFGPYPPWA
ncbi:hypothetical protein HMPREF9489_1547 [Finegoldia magna SY403409CC001050417]|nr:hypothetical protein HMPREF9489_1547 [Finegoldia magna SY403409CC001050417]